MAASDATFEAMKFITHTFSFICRGCEIIVVIYLTAQYFKTNSKFRSAYFVILNVGYIADLLMFIHWALPLSQNEYLYTILFHEWHNTYFMTIWNAVLCFNRSTSLAFPLRYEKLWTHRSMAILVPLMIIFPFIISGYELFSLPCTMQNLLPCIPFRVSYYFKGTILNVAINLISILFIIYAMYKSHKNKSKFHLLYEKIERRLIYQAILSSISQLIYFLLNFAASILFVDIQTVYFWGYVATIFYYGQHLIVILTHFIFSPSLRRDFMGFYRLRRIFDYKSKVASRVIVIPSNPQLHLSHVTASSALT